MGRTGNGEKIDADPSFRYYGSMFISVLLVQTEKNKNSL